MSHSCRGTAGPVLKNLVDWCGHWERKKTQRTGSFYTPVAKVHTFRKPALADDMGRLLSCRLSSHSASGKSLHSIAYNYTRYRWTPNISADSISAALIWSKCLSSLKSFEHTAQLQISGSPKYPVLFSETHTKGKLWISQPLCVSSLSVNNVDKYFKLSPEWS